MDAAVVTTGRTRTSAAASQIAVEDSSFERIRRRGDPCRELNGFLLPSPGACNRHIHGMPAIRLSGLPQPEFGACPGYLRQGRYSRGGWRLPHFEWIVGHPEVGRKHPSRNQIGDCLMPTPPTESKTVHGPVSTMMWQGRMATAAAMPSMRRSGKPRGRGREFLSVAVCPQLSSGVFWTATTLL